MTDILKEQQKQARAYSLGPIIVFVLALTGSAAVVFFLSGFLQAALGNIIKIVH